MSECKYSIKTNKSQQTCFLINNIEIGNEFFVIAGPCSVESEKQIITIARSVAKSGAKMLRGGAFKPRTSPYSFQGFGKEALEFLVKARDETGLPFVTEVLDTRDVELVAKYADVIQIGARNSQNYALLKEVGKLDRPVLLKRGFSMSIEELLYSAEYIMNEGNSKVILCERGIRAGINTSSIFDINMIPTIKQLTHLPIISDPSHGTGNRNIVSPIALASIMAGANALMMEVHDNPPSAWSDAKQQISLDEFDELMKKIAIVNETKQKIDIEF